jgi:hypothetical protein
MDADGQNQRNLTNHPADDGFADWFDPAFARIISPVDKLIGTLGGLKQENK